MSKIQNNEIRTAAKVANVHLWEIAHALGISSEYFSKKLRFEFPDDERQRCLDIISELSEEHS